MDCGVNPRCPITGIPALINAFICGVTFAPPSIFTACTPASLKKRMEVCKACSGDCSNEPNGRSATTSARFVALTTARDSEIISSTVTEIVFSAPKKLLPALSPTSNTGIPACSNISAVSCS